MADARDNRPVCIIADFLWVSMKLNKNSETVTIDNISVSRKAFERFEQDYGDFLKEYEEIKQLLCDGQEGLSFSGSQELLNPSAETRKKLQAFREKILAAIKAAEQLEGNMMGNLSLPKAS